MKRQDNLFISKLVDKVLNETIEERANSLVSKLKHKEMKEGGSRIKGLINQMKGEVNELGGMDDGHPKLGGKRFKKDMSDDEINDILNQLRMGDDDDFEDGVDEIPFEKGRRDYEDDDFDNELDENYDSEDLQNQFDDMEYDDFDFESSEGRLRPNLRDLEGGTTHGREFMKDFEDRRDFIKKLRRGFRGEENEEQLYEIEMDSRGEVCEQCGVGEVSEGVCNECGSSSGMMDESDNIEVNETNTEGCKAVNEVIKGQNGEVTELDQDLLERYNCGSLKESLIRRGLLSESVKRGKKKQSKGQDYIASQAEPKDKIDAKDFKVLRDKKSKSEKEVDEGNEFTGELAKAKKEGKSSFSVDGKKYPVKESIKLTESELISLIEEMVNEELTVAGNKPKGLSEYEKSRKGTEKENKEYFKSLKKKMDDYLKDGSKGDYEENPKHFPKGNGQLEKMKAKKYTMSDDGKEFLDDFMRPGQENLDYDEIHPNEDWMKSNIEGSSKTGNNPKWANAEETELGEKINKKRRENKFAKAKKMAYNKSAQPVISDKTGEDSGSGLNIKLESTNKETKMLNEEFEKIKNLMKYDRKTQ